MQSEASMETRSERRLAAIVAADVAGWSRLMGCDEEGTLRRLKALRREVIDLEIARSRGRIVKTTGDGILIEFPSVVDALHCALAVQDAMRERNRDEPTETRIEFRVGINLGDVILDGGDVFGDGVNIAARLEALAEPGGICISQTVLDHARGKLPFAAEDAGEQRLKNIVQPVHVWRVGSGLSQAALAAPSGATAPAEGKPTIAVLPFVNMSGDPEQEFFVDGLTEDILTELSRFRDLFVTSRNSVFVYKGKPVNVQKVAQELGVEYLVEGSVRKAGNRVRINVQLIEAGTDRHLWAERYDRELKDIFDIQDELTTAIAAILPGRVEAAVRERVKRKHTDNLAAWELVLAGKLLHHRSNLADNAEAQKLLARAIALDPNYAHAHAWRACALGQTYSNGWCADPTATVAEVLAELRIALALDDTDSDVHRILAAATLVVHNDLERAMHHQERALALNPNDDLIVVQQGEMLTWLGRGDEGAEWIRKAMRLNPYHPERFWNHLGRAYFVARRYQDAAEAFARISHPTLAHHAWLGACRACMDDAAGAAALVRDILAADPAYTVATHLAMQHYREAADREHHGGALRRAGLPE
jgi:adenylate cyclase